MNGHWSHIGASNTILAVKYSGGIGSGYDVNTNTNTNSNSAMAAAASVDKAMSVISKLQNVINIVKTRNDWSKEYRINGSI